MKNISPNIYTTALVLFIVLSGSCKKESLSVELRQTSFNTSFDLQLSEKILVKSDDRELKIELRSLNDYRCATANPYESTGNATARIFLSDHAHRAEAETNLCIGKCRELNKTSDTVSVTLDKKQYSLILKRIFGSQDKKAELQINTN